MQNKYEVIGVVGEGAYGIVYKCRIKETNEYVAIKKFKESDDEIVKKTMKRELKMLKQLKHPNIVEFKEAFKKKKNLYLVFEYVDRNLLELLQSKPNGLDQKLIKNLIYQLCKSIKYLHENNIIHRDIKPENLLVDNKMNLKLCDFGFARRVNIDSRVPITDYVATRWYRSPELLLTGGVYGPEVDFWAIGCIMGELVDGNPLFPGENEVDQLDCIQKVLGNFGQEQINLFYSNPIFEGKVLGKFYRCETLEGRYFGKLNHLGINFLKGLLEFDVKKRLNAHSVFKHPYFKELVEKDKDFVNNNIIVKDNNDGGNHQIVNKNNTNNHNSNNNSYKNSNSNNSNNSNYNNNNNNNNNNNINSRILDNNNGKNNNSGINNNLTNSNFYTTMIHSLSNKDGNISKIKKINLQGYSSLKNINSKIKNESTANLSEILKSPKTIKNEDGNIDIIKVIPPEKEEKTERTTNINIINYNIFNNIPNQQNEIKEEKQNQIHYNKGINLTPIKHNSNSLPKQNFNLSFNNTMSIIKSPSKIIKKEKKLNSMYSYSSININKKINDNDLYKTFFKHNDNNNDIYNYNINTHFEEGNKNKKSEKINKINNHLYKKIDFKSSNNIIYEDLEYSPPRFRKIKQTKIGNKSSIHYQKPQKNKGLSNSIYGNFGFRKSNFSLPILKKRGFGYV